MTRRNQDIGPVNPHRIEPRIIGFYDGLARGSGFISMTLDVNVNGTDHISNFTTLAGANTYFFNHAVDYGPLSGTSLTLDISLSITKFMFEYRNDTVININLRS